MKWMGGGASRRPFILSASFGVNLVNQPELTLFGPN